MWLGGPRDHMNRRIPQAIVSAIPGVLSLKTRIQDCDVYVAPSSNSGPGGLVQQHRPGLYPQAPQTFKGSGG